MYTERSIVEIRNDNTSYSLTEKAIMSVLKKVTNHSGM
jgi:hypothetical protein